MSHLNVNFLILSYDGEDDSFFVLADGDETVSREIQTTSQVVEL